MKTSQNTAFFSTLLLISMSIFSCDPGVNHKKVIVNASDYDLLVTIYQDSSSSNNEAYEASSFLIGKHSEVDIMDTGGLGQTKQFEDCSTYSDSISTEILGNDSLHLILNLGDRSNWTYSLLDKTFKGGGKCECRIQIGNGHIQ